MKNIFFLIVLFVFSCSNNFQNSQKPSPDSSPSLESNTDNLVTLVNTSNDPNEDFYIYGDSRYAKQENSVYSATILQYGTSALNSDGNYFENLQAGLYIENRSNQTQQMNISIPTNPSDLIQIKTNQCIGALKPMERCFLLIGLKDFKTLIPYGGYINQNYRIQLTSNPLYYFEDLLFIDLRYLAQETAPTATPTFSMNTTMLTKFDNYTLGERMTRRITIQNTGKEVLTNLQIQIPSNYMLKLNQCPTTLKKKTSCSILLYYSSKVAPPQATDQVSVSADRVSTLSIPLLSQ